MTRYGPARVVVAAVVLFGSAFVGARGVGPVPPVGPLLDPASGIWSVARQTAMPGEVVATIPTLEDEVRVVYDRRGVPHIWATSIDDVMRALGYVVARDRLFQMELQTRAVAGRLTELVGPQALSVDREQRELGLARSADEIFDNLDPNSEVGRAVLGYAEGVNAWIEAMEPGDLPFEYHLLHAKPETWEPVYTAYLLKRMGYTLAYSRHELWRSDVERLIGEDAAAALFPANNPIQEPIQPNGLARPRLDFVEPPPPARTGVTIGQTARLPSATADPNHRAPVVALAWDGAAGRSMPGIGSNNWAVAPSRSASGNALLAGDPHLNLTLPSIWYEAHLVVPGEMDAYGVTIPGSPGIIIGFNRDAAWSMTNTGADVLDFYRERLDDPLTPTTYLVDGEWRRLGKTVEQYLDPSGAVIATDTMYQTHRGPLLRTESGSLSMRWTVLEETGATESLIAGSKAASVLEFFAATETFLAPAQNMIVADRQGNIGIRSTGRYPRRPAGEGWSVRDGTNSGEDWSGAWPIEQYPMAINPEQGFIASANQQPTDPQADGDYLGVNWPSPWRAVRINQLLRADSQVTPDAMRRYQTDPGNARADWFVPLFLEAARDLPAGGREPGDLTRAARLLGEWDRRYTKDNERAILFETAMDELADRTWDELVPPGDESRIATPGSAILAQLTAYPESAWWDLIASEERETRNDIFAASLEAALGIVEREYGPPDSGGWRWDAIRHENIWHLAGFQSLSALGVPVQGGPGNLNPSSGSGRHGASWRMVVELAPEVRAWATYPGGQSGNPVSEWYEDRIPQWADGELDEILFPRRADDLADTDVAARLTLITGER